MRRESWPEILDAEVHLAMFRPFDWGTHDCCIFAADVVKALTGVDAMADLRGRYASAAEALRLINSLGGLEQAITARLGPAKPVNFAERGDVVLAHLTHGDTAGIRLTTTCAFPGEQGLVFVPLRQCRAAWSV